jgi:hypothetical protein
MDFCETSRDRAIGKERISEEGSRAIAELLMLHAGIIVSPL